jgi:hypothetical protein
VTKFRKTSEIRLNPANPRIIRDEKYRVLVRSVAQFPKMLDKRGIVVDGSKMILGGNQRWRAILDILKMPESELTALLNGDTETFARWEILREKQAVPENWIVDGSDMTDDEIRRFIIADNVEMGEHDWDMLANQWDADELSDWGVDVPGFGEGGAFDYDDPGGVTTQEARATLAERFIIPPFSVFDTRQGYWQTRKRAWLSIGIRSEIGRGGGMTYKDHEWQRDKLGKIQAPVAVKMALHKDSKQRKSKYDKR